MSLPNIKNDDAGYILARVYSLILQAARERKARLVEATSKPTIDESPDQSLIPTLIQIIPGQKFTQELEVSELDGKKEDAIENNQ